MWNHRESTQQLSQKRSPYTWSMTWTSNPQNTRVILLLSLFLLAVLPAHHSCYYSEHLYLSHRKCWPLTNSYLGNYNLNYTRWLHNQNFPSPQAALPQPIPALPTHATVRGLPYCPETEEKIMSVPALCHAESYNGLYILFIFDEKQRMRKKAIRSLQSPGL